MISKNRRAFSLLELSLVILIIGLLVIGVVGAKHLINKARLSSASALSVSSPINSIIDIEAWFETTNNLVSYDDATLELTSWGDNSPNQDKPVITIEGISGSGGPFYSNSINGVHAIRFTSSSLTDFVQISDASFLNNTDYTIMVTEKRMALNDSGSKNYLIGEDGSFALGYESDSTIIQTHGENASADNSASIESFSSYFNKPRVITFTHSSTQGNKIYINGTLANEDTSGDALSHLTSISTLAIGKNYNGEIGEIVIFSRALKSVEVTEVEDYLTDKFNAPNNRATTSSCTSGTILSSGCDASCAISGINGVATTSLASGSSSSYACGTGYNGSTPEYSCVDGVLSPSINANDCVSNGCATGYLPSSNSCVQGCEVDVITGTSSSGLTVADGVVVTCDVTGYDGANLGTCSSGGAISGSCSCDTGYEGGDCSTCSTNYSDYDSNGTCEERCQINSQAGIVDGTYVDSGSTSFNCNDPSASGGNITYTCNNGTLDNIVNNCVVPTCVGGDNVDTTTFAGDTIHVFTTVGPHILTCNQNVVAQVLVVAGGGGGGGNHQNYSAGGGGAGGLIYNNSVPLIVSSYDIVVGAGGLGGQGHGQNRGKPGQNGGNSQFDNLIAIGGGGGGGALPLSSDLDTDLAQDGGSGGGESTTFSPGSYVGGIGTSGQGNNGGDLTFAFKFAASGGGGAGAVGGNATGSGQNTDSIPGNGGDGLDYSAQFGTSYGESGWFAGGGAGGKESNTNDAFGGQGGGGDSTTSGHNGQNGTGGGGSGATDNSGNGFRGGSGIVIIRYTNP